MSRWALRSERASEWSKVEHCGESEQVDERFGANERASEWLIFHDFRDFQLNRRFCASSLFQRKIITMRVYETPTRRRNQIGRSIHYDRQTRKSKDKRLRLVSDFVATSPTVLDKNHASKTRQKTKQRKIHQLSCEWQKRPKMQPFSSNQPDLSSEWKISSTCITTSYQISPTRAIATKATAKIKIDQFDQSH